jgi:hypothetical protein
MFGVAEISRSYMLIAVITFLDRGNSTGLFLTLKRGCSLIRL